LEFISGNGELQLSQRVIYYDEVRVGNANSSYDEVKPGGFISI
jgi:hypothetical protein